MRGCMCYENIRNSETHGQKYKQEEMKVIIKVEHRDSKCDFLKKKKAIWFYICHRLILWNVLLKMMHVFLLIIRPKL